MTDVLDDFFGKVVKVGETLHKPRVLPDIWLTKSIITSNGKTLRISAGDQVKIVNGELVDCNDLPSHEIVECYGASTHSFSIKVKNLENNIKETIKL